MSHDGCGCGCGGHGGSCATPADMPDWKNLPDETMVCHCNQVDKGAVRRAVEMGAYTVPLLKISAGAGRCKPDCGKTSPLGRCCEPDLHELIRIYHQGPPEWLERGPCCG